MQSTLTDTIRIFYKGNIYEADQNLLCRASKSFSELLKNYYYENGENEKLQLEILNENFNERNISNFLKICQNLPTDVQNYEIQEICEIALMFQANEIYDQAISFIHSNIDQNFQIPEGKYNQNLSNFFKITSSAKQNHHYIDFNELEFESDESDDDLLENSNMNNNNITSSDIKSYQSQYSNQTSVIYLIKSEIFSRGQRFIFMKNNQVLMSAKVKGSKVFISNKNEINFETNTVNSMPRIEREQNLCDKIILSNQKISIKHILGKDFHFSIETSFQCDDKTFNLYPKDLDMKTSSSEYKQLISGLNNRSFKRSNKNMALKDKNGSIEFIVRKVGHNSFETECNSEISEIIAFSITICQIVGPFFDSSDVLTYGNQKIMPNIAFSIA